MFYYEVAVAIDQKSKSATFTYCSSLAISAGTFVEVQFKQRVCFGFVVDITTKPSFKTLEINRVYEYRLPDHLLQVYLQLRDQQPFSGLQIAKLFTPPARMINRDKLPELVGDSPTPKKLMSLNSSQKKITNSIVNDNRNCILFGDTGTGKTRMYTHVIYEALREGNALLLEPEIGLSSYIYEQVREYFPNTALYHSNLTPKRRQTIWQQVHNTKKGLLIIGPRSVLGLPINNPKVIILDEAHDSSYRQDNSPNLYAQQLSALISKFAKDCYYIYGSATPNVSDYYYASQLGLPIHRITKPAVEKSSSHSTNIEVINYEDAKGNLASKGVLLPRTMETVKSSLSTKEQVMIVLNRRGTARIVNCTNCGFILKCGVCEHMYVYHHDTHQLRCHYCSRAEPMPSACPKCLKGSLTMVPFGTKAIQLEVEKLMPGVALRRFDSDTKKSEHLSEFANEISSGEIQCIIGTQMIVKGLDLPKLKILVVVDDSLGSGYTNEERHFQFLYQVIGRATRGHQNTQILVQTTNDNSHIIKSAVSRSYLDFYESELEERQGFIYPPFCHMMIIHYSRKSSKASRIAGTNLVRKLTSHYRAVNISLPIPNLTERIGKQYHWHILIKAKDKVKLRSIAMQLGTSWQCEFDPISIP